mmetsp:Transcript_9623/g.15513  ORF Transcript_9623/g.15513 Transcript_9623/m.15513 type:complete len:154 (-) Transcript_9623:575-1036(-)
MAKGRRPSATSSSSNASKAKAIYMTKKEYKDVRVLWSRKSIEMFEKLSPTMSTAQQIQLKRFLKNMFKSIFTQVEKHATIGGRRPKKNSDESKPSAKDIKMRKEKLLEMVNEVVYSCVMSTAEEMGVSGAANHNIFFTTLLTRLDCQEVLRVQ